MSSPRSSFLQLPVELRLQIYSHLLQPNSASPIPPAVSPRQQMGGLFALDRSESDFQPPSPKSPDLNGRTPNQATLHIRTLEPRAFCSLNSSSPKTACSFIVRDFRGRAIPTTYHLTPNPDLYPSILSACRQTYLEASQVLYSANAFDFGPSVEALVPFFASLSPWTRSLVRQLKLVKRPQCYDKEFDRAEWNAAMGFVAAELNGLARLDLCAMTGRPAPNLHVFGSREALEGVRPYEGVEWEALLDVEGFEWLRDLVRIRGLKEICVEAVEGHCPPPVSEGLERWVRFSRSVGGSFPGFLRGRMLQVAGQAAA